MMHKCVIYIVTWFLVPLGMNKHKQSFFKTKQNYNNDIECKEKCRLGKISESQMGFEPTTLRDLVGCSNHWATGDSMVSNTQGL